MPTGLGRGWEDGADEPTGFSRPDGWAPLDDAEQPPELVIADPVPVPFPPSAQPARDVPESRPATKRTRKRAARKRKPTAGGAADPKPAQAAKVKPSRAGRKPRKRPAKKKWEFPRGKVAVGILAGMVIAVPVLEQLPRWLDPDTSRPLPSLPPARSFPPSPMPPTATGSPVPDLVPAALDWEVEATSLRPDLEHPEFLAPDNVADAERHIIPVGNSWLALTGNRWLDLDLKRRDAQVVVHALDSATGKQRWKRPMRSGLCATKPLGGSVVCAAATRIDAETGLGTQWRLELLDPATGAVTGQRVVDGWFTSLEVHHDRLVVLEQRQPAPHALVRSFDASLAPLWTTDLAGQVNQRLMFSPNRTIERSDLTVPRGLALDRVRIREVGDDWLAVTARATAFIDPDTGRLAAMPVCSRMVFDGTRIWCNLPSQAQAYDLELNKLVTTTAGIRLAFVTRDPLASDTLVPVFLDQSGRVVDVDPKTGRSKGVLLATEPAGSFTGSVPVSTAQSGTLVLIAAEGLIRLDGATRRPLWGQAGIRTVDTAHQRPDGTALVTELNRIYVVEPDTGTVVHAARFSNALYLEPVDDAAARLATWDMGVVGRATIR